MSNGHQQRNAARAAIDRVVRDAFGIVAGQHPRTRSAFGRLLQMVRSRTGLLRPAPVGGRMEVGGPADVVGGLLALAAHHGDWLRPVEGWDPPEGHRRQFGALAQHLLAEYPVPAFMASAWLRGRGDDASRIQGWYKHLGRGRNIRTADLPLPFTRRMSHHFALAPDHFSIEMALRLGQVRGLGGSKGLAVAIAATRLGRTFEHESFWRTVVFFFVNHPTLEPAHVGPVVDYLHHQRFVPRELFVEEGELAEPGRRSRTSR